MEQYQEMVGHAGPCRTGQEIQQYPEQSMDLWTRPDYPVQIGYQAWPRPGHAQKSGAFLLIIGLVIGGGISIAVFSLFMLLNKPQQQAPIINNPPANNTYVNPNCRLFCGS